MHNLSRIVVNEGDEILVSVSRNSTFYYPKWSVAKYLVKRNIDGHLILKFIEYVGATSRSYEKVFRNAEMSFSNLRSLTKISCVLCHLESVIPKTPLKSLITTRMRKSNNYKLTKEEKFLIEIAPKWRNKINE